jgi:sterol desaturase/sphingolipid hydroxylase (fatty acid hydroxylase superfamily)
VSAYWTTFADAWIGYARWAWTDLTQPGWHSFATALIGISGLWLVLEQLVPWRAQPRIRDSYWLDLFYIAVNCWLFALLGFQALATTAHAAFLDALARVGLTDLTVVSAAALPVWAQLVAYLVLRDLVQYGVHRLLHRVPFLWRFHQVHHSAREMGFATNLRFHPMETVVYRSLELIPMSLVGFGVEDWFLVHVFSLFIGHWNHANVRIPLGPLRYVLNHPQMHVFHHAHVVPAAYGVNFGVVLSVWDWLFGTAWIPDDGRTVELGFDGVESYPKDFVGQMIEPVRGADLRASARPVG